MIPTVSQKSLYIYSSMLIIKMVQSNYLLTILSTGQNFGQGTEDNMQLCDVTFLGVNVHPLIHHQLFGANTMQHHKISYRIQTGLFEPDILEHSISCLSNLLDSIYIINVFSK